MILSNIVSGSTVGKSVLLDRHRPSGWRVGSVFFWYILDIRATSVGGVIKVVSVSETPVDLLDGLRASEDPVGIAISRLYFDKGAKITDLSRLIFLGDNRTSSNFELIEMVHTLLPIYKKGVRLDIGALLTIFQQKKRNDNKRKEAGR